MTSIVRPAGFDDAFGIAEAHVLGWRAAYAGIVPAAHLDGLSVEKRCAFWKERIANGLPERMTVLVAEEDARVVGFANVGPSRDEGADAATGELRALYLLPSHWDRGVGRALHDRGIGALAAAGFTTATLWVLEANARGRRFYERRGWAPEGAVKTIALGGSDLAEMRYRLDLGRTATSPRREGSNA